MADHRRPACANLALMRAQICLAHPLSVAAAILLLLNALWLQPHFPSWLTGKLGDAAWLLIAPLVLATALGWLIPPRRPDQARLAGGLALLLAGAPFVLVKTLPAANLAARDLYFALTGLPAKLQADPSDLLALPALAAAGWLWHRAGAAGAALRSPHAVGTRRRAVRPDMPPWLSGPGSPRPGRPARAWLGLGLAALALLADSPDPRGFFVSCLARRDGSLNGFSWVSGEPGGAAWNAFRSDDGGLTWHYYIRQSQELPPTSEITAQNAATPGILQTIEAGHAANERERAALDPLARACPNRQGDFWEYAPPEQPYLRYRFFQERAIDRSTDGGQTWQHDRALEQGEKVLAALLDPATGNLVLAETGSGSRIRVRLPDGRWTAGRPPDYGYDESATPVTPPAGSAAAPVSPLPTP